MLKTALFDCAINEKNLQCWRRTGHPISSRFLCPRPPLLLSAPNQNRHATQATRNLSSKTKKMLIPGGISLKEGGGGLAQLELTDA